MYIFLLTGIAYFKNLKALYCNNNNLTLVLSDYAVIATGGKSTFTAEQAKAADVDGDGKYDSIDASIILAYYAYTSTGGTGTLEEYLNS